MNEHSGELGAIARHWFTLMRSCGEDVREVLHDGAPTACVADAAFAYVNAFKAHVNVGFFRGAELEHTWRLSTQPERTPDELALALSGFLAQRGMSFESQVTGVVIASVVPDVTAAVREMAARYFPFPPVIVGPGVKTGAGGGGE
jgi:hypothetical protein